MIRLLFLGFICSALAGCLAAAPAADLVVGAVGRAVADKINNQLGVAPQPNQAAAAPSGAPQPVTVLDFDVPSDALKAKDAELSKLLRKVGEVALKYDVPVMLVSNSADRDYLMREINQAGEPVIMYRLGEYPRLTITLKSNAPPRQGDKR